jgi:hypothetical protein
MKFEKKNFQELKISLSQRMINEDVSALEPSAFNDNFEGIRYEKKNANTEIHYPNKNFLS